MAYVDISERKFAKKISKISAGDRVALDVGTYRKPMVFDGKIGTKQNPIFIEPASTAPGHEVVFRSELTTDNAKKWANGVANRRQKSGYYPSIGHLGDQAMLVLRNCQYVVIQGLNFTDCWPGAIYLDNCQHVVIHDVRFEGGTIAIGASGLYTRDIIIQHCQWQQDISGSEMWDTVPWGRIHGASDNSDVSSVDLDGDYRHWDGDFFRSWDIGGNITIRKNKITDAFNGIHFFNSVDKLAPGVVADRLAFNSGRRSSSNVLIEDNEFVRVRDNVFEPEQHAWNWVIRHNKLRDCYRPFSFEFERAGFFYIYGNTGSFNVPPSMHLSKEDKKHFEGGLRQSGSLFKPKGKQANEGAIYVAFNSWYYGKKSKGKGILPKYGLGKLVHVNNAIQYGRPDRARFFGNDGSRATVLPFDLSVEKLAEEKRFTRRWNDYQIEVDGDVANDDLFPQGYRSLGYDIGLQAVQASPEFKSPKASDTSTPDFSSTSEAIVGTSIGFELGLPDGTTEKICEGLNRGAVQAEGGFASIDCHLGFLPEDCWLPPLSTARWSPTK